MLLVECGQSFSFHLMVRGLLSELYWTPTPGFVITFGCLGAELQVTAKPLKWWLWLRRQVAENTGRGNERGQGMRLISLRIS